MEIGPVDLHTGREVGQCAALDEFVRLAALDSGGTVWIAQLAPLATAAELRPGSALVSENTTCRLRRTASVCAVRKPFCNASDTLRMRVLRIIVPKNGIASPSRSPAT